MGELWEVLTNHFPQFRSGFFMTLKIISVSFLVAMVVGTVIAAFRVAPSRLLRAIGTTYVEIFRNLPLLVLIYIIFLGLRRAGYEIEREPSAWAALGLYTAAYVAEAIRSGIFAVGKGQIDASLSLGFTYGETLRKVVLPQAVRTVIPPLGNLTIAMIKNSAIIGVSILALEDLLKEARNINSNTFRTNEVFFWAAVGYLILTVTATFIVRSLERRLAIKR
jgi:His/Glu/Gln/Arg/opine family amino acid ABC transporter permease subunit